MSKLGQIKIFSFARKTGLTYYTSGRFKDTKCVNRSALHSSVNRNKNYSQQCRFYGVSKPDEEKKIVQLMDFQPAVWPSVIHTIKNWFFGKVIIQPYFDKDFDIREFGKGAKQALLTISSHLAAGHFDKLEGLVTTEALLEIQRNYAHLNMDQRMSLEVVSDDVFFYFPYQIGIILNDNTKQRFAEIMVVYHCMKDFKTLQESPYKQGMDYNKRVTVCNYRFIREYTKGIESGWTVNLLNHFRLD